MNAKSYIITQTDKYMYSIKITGNNNHNNAIMLYTLLKIVIQNSFYDETTSVLFFNAENVQNLTTHLQTYNNKLPHNKCIILTDHLSKQMKYLKHMGYGHYGFDLDDIIVIDDNTYIIINTTYLLPLINNNFIFYGPFEMPFFSSPELYDIQTLPSEINYNTCYYSLGALLLHCLLRTSVMLNKNEFIGDIELDKILYPLYNTKIYWFLKRCCKTISNKRILLLI